MGAEGPPEASSIVAESAYRFRPASGAERAAQRTSRLARGDFGDDDAAPRPSSTPVFQWPADPTIIGASGGSGTRVIARILRRAGAFIGSDLNAVEDSMPLAAFCDLWANVFAARSKLFDEHEA